MQFVTCTTLGKTQNMPPAQTAGLPCPTASFGVQLKEMPVRIVIEFHGDSNESLTGFIEWPDTVRKQKKE